MLASELISKIRDLIDDNYSVPVYSDGHIIDKINASIDSLNDSISVFNEAKYLGIKKDVSIYNIKKEVKTLKSVYIDEKSIPFITVSDISKEKGGEWESDSGDEIKYVVVDYVSQGRIIFYPRLQPVSYIASFSPVYGIVTELEVEKFNFDTGFFYEEEDSLLSGDQTYAKVAKLIYSKNLKIEEGTEEIPDRLENYLRYYASYLILSSSSSDVNAQVSLTFLRDAEKFKMDMTYSVKERSSEVIKSTGDYDNWYN